MGLDRKERLRLLVGLGLLEHPVVTAVGDFDQERQIGLAEAVRPLPVVALVAVDAGERAVEPDVAVVVLVFPDGPTMRPRRTS